ncbi:hypothetical protein NX059_012442 [Plenodomus lindquistii]|nr:hypothetical protein NX059_012442 [Plenodomus lindquistii]
MAQHYIDLRSASPDQRLPVVVPGSESSGVVMRDASTQVVPSTQSLDSSTSSMARIENMVVAIKKDNVKLAEKLEQISVDAIKQLDRFGEVVSDASRDHRQSTSAHIDYVNQFLRMRIPSNEERENLQQQMSAGQDRLKDILKRIDKLEKRLFPPPATRQSKRKSEQKTPESPVEQGQSSVVGTAGLHE